MFCLFRVFCVPIGIPQQQLVPSSARFKARDFSSSARAAQDVQRCFARQKSFVLLFLEATEAYSL